METGTDELTTVNVVTFLRTSEEAINLVDNVWEYETPSASVTALTSAFDDTTNTLELTLEGTGFGTDADSIELYIDGERQTSLTAADTVATFTLDSILDESSSDVRVYFADGLPTGYQDVSSITVYPTLLSISPSVGSFGGTLITVTGVGFGVNTGDINILHEATNEEICEETNILGYGQFTCLTKSMEIAATDNLILVTSTGSYTCGNTLAPEECGFEQAEATSPTISGASITSSSTIEVTGSAFPTADYDVVVIFMGVESSSAVINDDTSLVATFDNGIPLTAQSAAPSVRFIPSDGRRRLISLVDAGLQIIASITGITINNDLALTDSTSGLTCSYQGGCPYTVTGAGLTASLLDSEENYIDVCGNRCEIDSTSSNADSATCKLPYVSTAYSASNFEIVTQGMIHDGTWTGTASDEELAKLIDQKNMIDMIDETSTDCYFQIQYKENHVGVLDEVKFFVNQLIDKSPFDGNFKFQGSDDGVTFDDLWLINKSVHEGWNSLDFEEDSRPSYNIYRFQGATAGSCRVGEVRLHGVESIDSDADSHQCTPKLHLDGEITELNPVTFDAATTPVLTGMSNRFGSVLGGEEIVFYGTGFSDTAVTTVTIDDRDCEVTAQTTDAITCTTMDKPYRPDEPKLEIYIEGLGLVATKGQVFRYISRWSDDQTWGYDLSPQEGEAVHIPKGLHLLFDIDDCPLLSFVNIEGSLIFAPDADPNHQRNFQAHYILVKGGYMEVGTEEYRYTSKLTITMYSTKFDPNLPIFGNKVIGVNFGTLEMHGVERPVTWTDLWETAEIGATSITLNTVQGDPLDWAVGEEIVIASTDFAGRNAEQRTITSITNTDTNPVITFDEPLEFKHYAGVQYYGDDFIEMRAEVGLLTRNVKYQGDPDHSPDNQYGAVIICHSPGDESTVCRIDSIELTLVGQAFILGSYPIHFHMIGTVHSSYVRSNAIHHTFNRAVTIHGIHYLRVQNNVAYHTMGHTIFIEDAAETKNLIEGNLIVDVRRSWSLLNTDQSPASIWITNPNNIIRNNHAAGSDRYSYWYDTQVTAIGPSFDPNICPEHERLGEFRDNVAHSNGRYGLRIFHNHIPREHPCEPFIYSGNPDDPYPDNPPIIAKYYNLVSYKNRRAGAIAERIGAVQWIGFKTADNGESGMEISRTDDITFGFAEINDGLVIGRTENTEEFLDRREPVGVMNPRTEGLSVKNVRFYNYNWNNAAGMGTCSHCWHDNNTDSGARTITVWDLFFDSTCERRVKYTVPWRTIFLDKTGGMTGLGENSWFVPYWKHLLQPECQDKPEWGGIICDNTVEVRRIAIWGMPSNFYGMRLKILQFDRATEAAVKADGTYEEYLDTNSNYSLVPFKDKQKPSQGWAMPYVTGHRYSLHWEAGLDFDSMKIWVSEVWEETDQNVFLVFNFTESREAVNITSSYGRGEQLPDKSLIDKATADLVSGDNWVRNETDRREFELVINGKDTEYSRLIVEPLECIAGTCVLDTIEEVELEEGQRLWSDPESWGEGGKVPEEGDEVTIESGWNMVLDIEETPILESLTINGRLSFARLTDLNIHLRVKRIFVRAGEFVIGSEEEPFENEAKITLMGMQDEETVTLSGSVKAGNKVIAVTNQIAFYGKQRSRMTRLVSPVYEGSDVIYVEDAGDWQAGD